MGKRSGGFTPLGIIAMFVALSESIAGLAAVQTEGVIQLIFAIFAVAFPILVAALFFAVLWLRAYVYYPPQEFGQEVDVAKYVDAMRHQAVSNQELQGLVKTVISETLQSKAAAELLSRSMAERGSDKSRVIEEASIRLSEEAVERLQDAVLTIDISQLAKRSAPELVFAYEPDASAYALLSAVHVQIDEAVPPHTYGKRWALRDIATGDLMLPSTLNWSGKEVLLRSNLTVAGLGLRAGMRLQAVPLR